MLTGFTLIELLVAISILAIVAVLGWRGLDGIVRARIALTANLDQTRAMQLTFAQMQSDCAKIDSTVVLGHAPLVADQTRLMMVRAVYAEDQPSRLQVVTYRVRNGNLTRRESLATRDLGELAGAWQAAAA
ncbi:MAG: prepilin-type N-terminal cleavage/methylation domain-containing protein, partial [Herminiimonas sp.]|nr:prepilin-type N-terminal cleavage/methylation domain-containing protein [Herminiimonas sp.]